MESIINVLIDILCMVFITGGIVMMVVAIVCLIKSVIDFFRY